MNELKNDMEATLITTFKNYGVNIKPSDIPQILMLGVDTFFLRKGLSIPDKHLSELYLILHEMREHENS